MTSNQSVRGQIDNSVIRSKSEKKELAKKEHASYDSRHENLLITSKSRIL